MGDGYFFNFDKMTYVKGEKPRGCILCLLRDSHPSVVDLTVVRDPLFIASVNLYPYNPGHMMIFPVRHVEDVRELTAEEESRLCAVQRYMLDLLERAYAPHAFNIGFNMGHAAGASIEHLHLHIIPRYPHEMGISDLIAGKRVLVEDPVETTKRLRGLAAQLPFSSSRS